MCVQAGSRLGALCSRSEGGRGAARWPVGSTDLAKNSNGRSSSFAQDHRATNLLVADTHDMATCHVNVVPTAAAQHDDLAQAGVVGCGALTAAVVTTVPPGVVNDRLYIAGARPVGTLTKASDASPAVVDAVATTPPSLALTTATSAGSSPAPSTQTEPPPRGPTVELCTSAMRGGGVPPCCCGVAGSSSRSLIAL